MLFTRLRRHSSLNVAVKLMVVISLLAPRMAWADDCACGEGCQGAGCSHCLKKAGDSANTSDSKKETAEPTKSCCCCADADTPCCCEPDEDGETVRPEKAPSGKRSDSKSQENPQPLETSQTTISALPCDSQCCCNKVKQRSIFVQSATIRNWRIDELGCQVGDLTHVNGNRQHTVQTSEFTLISFHPVDSSQSLQVVLCKFLE